MSHLEHGEITLRLSSEQARALSTALAYYQLWLDVHPEEQELREDQPHIAKIEQEVQQQVTAQSPLRGSGRPVW